MDLEKGIEFSKAAIIKYGEKKTKLVELKNKLEGNSSYIKRFDKKWCHRRFMWS